MSEAQAKTILVVEDERPLAEAIHTKLESAGFDVVTARSTSQAEGYLEDGVNIRAIWLDHYLLGGEDGLSLVSKLKSDGAEYRNIPIFVVSNTASADKVQSYLQLGVNKYYTKTEYRLEEIIRDISENLENPEE